MGTRQNNLLKSLRLDYDLTNSVVVTLDNFRNSKWYDEIRSIYKELGGLLEEIPIFRPRDLDFVINGKVLELDEENHFNRYRAVTLNASIYQSGLTLNKMSYLKYCNSHEHKCRTTGRYWTSNSTERHFGTSNDWKDLNGNGSARWKQRAFYDMLRDHLPYVAQIPIKRISIYDVVENNGTEITVDKLLKSDKLDYSPLKSIVKKYVG